MNIKKNLDLILLIIVFIAVFALAIYWQASGNFADPDSFYHIKMAEFLGEGRLILDFPWQQYSILNENFTDQHFLYHIILAVFIKISGAYIGTKLCTAFLFAGFIFIFGLVLKNLHAKWPWLWSLVLALSVPFAFRLNLIKANSVSLIFLFLAIFLLYKYKPIWLFFISFLYVLAYGGFPIMVGMVFIYGVFNIIFNKKWKESLILFGSSLGGILVGIIINPYFPKNIDYYWQQFVQIGIINYQDKIGVGGEWYPYSLANLVSGASLVFLFLGIALFLFVYDFKRQKNLSWFAIIMMISFLGLTLKSKRYVEYAIPFIVFYSAIIISLSMPKKWLMQTFNFADYAVNKKWFYGITSITLILFFAFMVPAIIGSDIRKNKNDLSGGYSFYKYSQAAEWLQNNSEPGSIVLHSDWDDWPSLFFWNDHNYYIIGLDPTFMYNFNEDLYWKWVHITKGEEKENVYKQSKNDFNAAYMLVEQDHNSMDRNVRKDDRFEEVYEDDEAKIYELR